MAQEPTASFGRRLCMHTAGIRSRGCIVAWRVPHLRAMSSMAQISSGFAPKTSFLGVAFAPVQRFLAVDFVRRGFGFRHLVSWK